VAIDRVILAVRKIHGRGRVQLPKEVRQTLFLQDGDYVYFVQEGDRIFIEKSPKLRKGRVGKYL